MAEKNETRTARRKHKRKKKRSIWKPILLSILLVILAIGVAAGGIITYWIATAPSIDPSKLSDSYASIILDKDGNEVAMPGEIGGEKRIRVTYDELPQVLIDAVLATEDVRFFEHPGIDVRRIGAAIIANIQHGFGSEGASTITQQVVEKSFLSPEKKMSIKVQEAWLALQLERMYSKEEILEFYLNKIFYGNHSYGVAQAAKNYFGKDLDELTLPEAALLAGLPQRPTAYNPFENPELAQERMDTVLSLMVRHGKITEEEAKEASEVDVSSLLVESRPEPTPYDAFIEQVAIEVEEKLDADIHTDGLIVHTTLDTDIQDYVEDLMTIEGNSVISYPDNMQAGMVVLDTKSGAIQAIGGRLDDGEKHVNYALGTHQPGSTAKPIVSFGPAIEYNKISTYHQINDDAPYEAGGSNPIRNWNRQYQGWMSARYALSQSLNVPTVKLFDEVGSENAKKFAEGIGYEFATETVDPRDAIGGTATEVSPLQLAGTYRAFGNQGIYNEPYAVSKVEFPDGKTEDLTPEAEPAMSDYTAYMVTDMLKSVLTEGTGKRANIEGLPVAGKTGTTDENKDSWFAGYTTNYTIAAWAGGYDGDRKVPIPSGYANIPQDLFRHTMTEISQGVETQDFVKPESVVEVKVEKGSNPPKLPSAQTPSSNITTELFVKGTEPTSRSEKFDELDPVSELNATYNEETNSIEVSWNYNSDQDVSFEVSSSVDSGSMNVLSTTEDTSFEISEVETGSTYEIQVIAVSNETNTRSEARSVSVSTGEEEDEEIPGVSGLNASYNAEQGIIDVVWQYDGPDASFNVSVNGQTQSVESAGIEIGGVVPGTTYTISVTPVGKENEEEGETASTEVTIPEEEQPEEEQEDADEEPVEENNDQETPEDPQQNESDNTGNEDAVEEQEDNNEESEPTNTEENEEEQVEEEAETTEEETSSDE